MNNSENILSTNELWLLLSQFGPAFVLGIENPYQGWLAEEIEEAHKKAAESLLQRGLARPLTDETLDVDDSLFAAVEVCAHPKHTLVLQLSLAGNRSDQRYYHFRDQLQVGHYEKNPGEQTLQIFSSREELISEISGLLNVSREQKPGLDLSFILPEDTLYQAVNLAQNGSKDKIISLLNEAGLDQTEVEALALSLTKPLFNASLAVIVNQGESETQHVRGFGLLESEKHLLFMRPFERVGQPQVEFTTGGYAALQQKLEETLPGCSSQEEEA